MSDAPGTQSNRDGTLPHPYSEEWQPYRDHETGEVVTITWKQVWAVLHAVRVVEEVRRTQKRIIAGHGTILSRPLRDDFPEKSRALGRLLIEGKPLFEDVPPFAWGACDYTTWDDENAAHSAEDRAEGSGS